MMGEVHSYLAGLLQAQGAPPPLPRHRSSSLVVHVHRAVEAAELNPGPISWQHADGCHSFTIDTEFGPHEVTVSPPGERVRLLAELQDLRDRLRATRQVA
jgi:hypothetical protein